MPFEQPPKAPRRFLVTDDKVLVGTPSVPYGVIRRLAHEQRKHREEHYVRVLFGQGGRRGNPWGSLVLEVNGDLYHFNAGVKRWPEYHDASGNLTPSGQQALATGVPGNLTTSIDWRWVQDETDLTTRLSLQGIQEIADEFRQMLHGIVALPQFQAKTSAKRLGLHVSLNDEFHNCTTIILQSLRQKAGISVNEVLPLNAFDALQRMVGDNRSRLDHELHLLLSLSEERIAALMQSRTEERPDWEGISKGVSAFPQQLKWKDLVGEAEGLRGENH